VFSRDAADGIGDAVLRVGMRGREDNRDPVHQPGDARQSCGGKP
jgi:hypothetical protein